MVMHAASLSLLLAAIAPQGPNDPRPESDYVEIVDVKQPEGVVLEASGLLPRGDEILVATRRGEVWRLQDAYSDDPKYSLWAEGLMEPLGLLEHDGWIYVTQRGELSRMRDADGDGRMDQLETVNDHWELSGNYHEYCFGPVLAPDGSLWITLNKPFGGEPFGKVDWRGWAARITPEGKFEGVCAGLRSPAGVEASPLGEMFYTDNQGEWCANSKFALLEVGDFHGHPHGIASCNLPESLVEHPGEVPNGVTVGEAADQVKNYRLPVCWIPYDKVGRSPGGFVWDTAGHFGPFKGQVFVGDQYSSEVFRITYEKVGGRYQGACYPFRRGLKCGIIRVAWGSDGSLWCGMTNRGWPSKGGATNGLQRLAWKGGTPFELVETTAIPEGFALRFSQKVDPASVVPGSFTAKNWTYNHHSRYGSPEIDPRDLEVTAATLADDGMTVQLAVSGRVRTRVHALEAGGVRAAEGGAAPWHGISWYTLNAIPNE